VPETTRAGDVKDSKAQQITIVVEFEVRAGHMPDFIPIITAHATKALKNEVGCQAFEVLKVDKADKVILIERYRDDAALDWHREHSGIPELKKCFAPFINRETITVCRFT
jgi:quinol monooxygenase YgiN